MKTHVILLALGMAASASAYAQQPSMVDSLHSMKASSTKVVYIDGKPETEEARRSDLDSIKKVIGDFYYDQFRNFQDPDAPYFLFMSKEAGLALGVGGGVRLRAFYDWNGAMPNNSFAPMQIPIPPDPTSMKHFGTTPSGTYLFFRAMGHNTALGNYQLYVEGNFTGYNGRDFKLKKAYAMIRDFTFGYAASTFSDPAAEPAIIDAAGANNKMGVTSLLVRYMPTFKKHWSVGVSVETPATFVAADNVDTKAVSCWMPDFAALVQYQWARGQHVRLSGIVRTLPYRDLKTGTNHNRVGWGLQLSSVTHPVSNLTTYLTFNYGKGYGGLTGDLTYGNYDLVGDPNRPGTLYAPAAFGWCAGLQYNFSPTVFATIAASETRYLPQHTVAPDEYKYGIFACANVFWYITPRVYAAAEIDWGQRKNFSGEHRHANRANISAGFTF
ncbi:MAG: hypothetical protein Q4C37_04555 [Bacteroidales bacterium]|nr:hypothetical protein [Bacteroidales bacterium]